MLRVSETKALAAPFRLSPALCRFNTQGLFLTQVMAGIWHFGAPSE
jgi:hypothetical protein